ncbi:protein of unknown function [Candidatus Methylocalor cossyra]|uniref:Uncharacterized protein n=1 Tax=Candidatus Methylocalor cossyra TaxID=3108543 RepID=A0ABP1CCB0_9GAMM
MGLWAAIILWIYGTAALGGPLPAAEVPEPLKP